MQTTARLLASGRAFACLKEGVCLPQGGRPCLLCSREDNSFGIIGCAEIGGFNARSLLPVSWIVGKLRSVYYERVDLFYQILFQILIQFHWIVF